MAAKHLDRFDPNARQLVAASVEWMDRYWNESMGLLWDPGEQVDPHHPQSADHHMVRETGWYALGLLIRDNEHDLERALRALDMILTHQFDEPDQPYHGTFLRAPEEPRPPAEPLEWKHYDPNWREFIITTLSIILLEYEERLPRSLVQKIDAAIPKAVEGALARRLRASYTNIALMNAFMLCFAGDRLSQPAWFEHGENMAGEIYRLFKLNNTFEEYNSPTYYGVDLYALALWREYSTSPLLRQLGAEMEALLWADIAQFYHAGLLNLSGPFDRSYGMDMRRYVALVGEWIWLITGKEQAPFPAMDRPFAHAADFCFAPCVAILGAGVPPDVAPHFLAFQGERQVERVISDSPRRVATAWMSENIMLGAEHTSSIKRGYPQFHSATVYWKIGADDVGWIRLLHFEPVDVRASQNRLDISGAGKLVFRVCARNARADAIQADLWQLPDLTVQVATSTQAVHVEQKPDGIEIHYGADDGQSISCMLTTQVAQAL
jgi:hypothetical protein